MPTARSRIDLVMGDIVDSPDPAAKVIRSSPTRSAATPATLTSGDFNIVLTLTMQETLTSVAA
jgi:hypothetical protein